MWTNWINFGFTFLIIFVVLLVVTRLLRSLLLNLARRTSSEYDEAYLRSIRSQVDLLVFVVSIYFATPPFLPIQAPVLNILLQLYFSMIVLMIAIMVWKMIDHLVLWYKDLAKKAKVSNQKESALQLAQRTGHILVAVVSILTILDHFGVDVSALVATLGIGGLAISLAAQDTLSNMISGIMLLMDQPFRIGDRIEIQGLNTWGDVVDIGLRSTRIRTRDNRMVIVPNSSISKNQVINYTFPDPRYRVEMDIGVIYGSDLCVIREVITKAVKSVEGVLVDRPVDVLFMEFNELKMILRVRWWIESYTDSRKEFDKVNEAIYLALKEANIQMPSVTTTIEIANARVALQP